MKQLKYFYLVFIIVLAGCTLPNKRTQAWSNYYNDQWMYEKSYSQKVHESNQRRRNNDNRFAKMIPPGDPNEVIAVAYQFENYNGLTQEDQRRVAASDAYGSTNGVGIKVGQIYAGNPAQYQENMNSNDQNNNVIYEREPVNKEHGEFGALYEALNN
jgi:hypothetical protein